MHSDSRAHENESLEPGKSLTVPQVLLFYLLLFLVGWLVSFFLKAVGLSNLYDLVVNTSLYSLIFIPVAYAFDPRVLSKAYWRLPASAGYGIAFLGISQLILDSIGSPSHVSDPYIAFGAIAIAPLVEETLRAVVICPLMERLGPIAGLLTTALMWAWLHDFFWVALVQQVILSLIFVYTRKSLPAAMAAHTVMNVLAVWGIGLRTLVHYWK